MWAYLLPCVQTAALGHFFLGSVVRSGLPQSPLVWLLFTEQEFFWYTTSFFKGQKFVRKQVSTKKSLCCSNVSSQGQNQVKLTLLHEYFNNWWPWTSAFALYTLQISHYLWKCVRQALLFYCTRCWLHTSDKGPYLTAANRLSPFAVMIQSTLAELAATRAGISLGSSLKGNRSYSL